MPQKKNPSRKTPLLVFLVSLVSLLGYHNTIRDTPTTQLSAGVGEVPTNPTTIPQMPTTLPTSNSLPKTHRYVLGKSMYAGGQLRAEPFRLFMAEHRDIKNVIRLDAEWGATDMLSIEHERQIVRINGAEFYLYNIEGKQGPNETALQQIDAIMDAGSVYVHCKNGRHRAMLVLGRYYARKGYQWGTIVDLLDWQDIVNDPRYAKYVNNLWAYVQARNQPPKT